MTRREAKAEETARKITRSIIDGNRDWNHFILEAMAWQAEESKLNYIEYIVHLPQTGPLQFADEKVINAILNAGTEDV